jgi:hypothetical protein
MAKEELPLMKILTWNAAMRFRDKIENILPFSADISVIPECEAPEKWKTSNHRESIHQFLWFGDNLNKGIGIFTLNDSDTFIKRLNHLEVGSSKKWIHLSDHLPIYAEFQ